MKKPVKKNRKAKPLKKKVQSVKAEVQVQTKELKHPQAWGSDCDKVCENILKHQEAIQKKDYELWEMRFLQGAELKKVIGSYGPGVLTDIAKRVDMSRSYLYNLHGFAEHFDYSVDKMRKYYLSQVASGGNTTIKHVLKVANENPDAMKDPNKRELAKENKIKRIEDGAKAVQEIQEQGLGDEETTGATMMFAGELAEAGDDMLGDMGTSGIQKEPRQKLPEYLKFIREHCVCPVTGTPNPDPHHLTYLSSGNQASDLTCIPLARDVHDEFQRAGRKGLKKLEKSYSKLLGKPFRVGKVLMDTHYAFMKHLIEENKRLE